MLRQQKKNGVWLTVITVSRRHASSRAATNSKLSPEPSGGLPARHRANVHRYDQKLNAFVCKLRKLCRDLRRVQRADRSHRTRSVSWVGKSPLSSWRSSARPRPSFAFPHEVRRIYDQHVRESLNSQPASSSPKALLMTMPPAFRAPSTEEVAQAPPSWRVLSISFRFTSRPRLTFCRGYTEFGQLPHYVESPQQHEEHRTCSPMKSPILRHPTSALRRYVLEPVPASPSS